MTIEAMKQWRESLEELVPDPQCDFGPAYENMKRRQKEALKSIDQAIAEAEKQEPVAIATGIYGGRFTYVSNKPHVVFPDGTAFYTHPQPKREPLTNENPLLVFAKECVLGAYREDELADAAFKAIEAYHGIKEKNT
jgi:hypothetical protein